MAAARLSDVAIPPMAEPEEITRLVLFVASDEASFSTGSEFIADGGQLLGPGAGLQPLSYKENLLRNTPGNIRWCGADRSKYPF
jgi:hypothetical protein